MSVAVALGDVRYVLREATAAIDALEGERKRVLRRLRRRRGEKLQDLSAMAEPGASRAETAPALFLVLGVVTNPRTPQTREWIRSFSFAPASTAGAPALLRFIVGRRGLSPRDGAALDAERKRVGHDDFAEIDATDFNEAGGIYSCIDKLFEWFRPKSVARRLPPR
jgi:hypothetical protein